MKCSLTTVSAVARRLAQDAQSAPPRQSCAPPHRQKYEAASWRTASAFDCGGYRGVGPGDPKSSFEIGEPRCSVSLATGPVHRYRELVKGQRCRRHPTLADVTVRSIHRSSLGFPSLVVLPLLAVVPLLALPLIAPISVAVALVPPAGPHLPHKLPNRMSRSERRREL